MADVRPDTARLIALFFSCILYGILAATFVPSIRSLILSPVGRFRLKKSQEIKYPIVATTVLMFVVSTFAAILSFHDVVDAFIDYDGPGGALEFYNAKIGGWKHWFVAVEDSTQVILGDAMLIYRCYVLHGRSWRCIAIPGLLCWLGLCVSAMLSSYRETQLSKGQSLNDPSVLPFLTATLLLTLATSLITTYLITRRLFTAGNSREQTPSPNTLPSHFFDRAAMIFFETGMIYSLSVVASLGVYLSGSNIEYVATVSMIHIIPITCNLLLIRVGAIDRTQARAEKSLNKAEAKV
ncbi:hypothetical protein FB45DRAFT_840771 [Roridomyces roridus]|uniref:Uncharacterized protein n=1 Tax=Roridomyces roridus TaxID=1738132 RepID=A0AAD7BDZ2_9AGAR|nr:hypothetical protein FB45DRAFT_840771 [Roridomyces roridus]